MQTVLVGDCLDILAGRSGFEAVVSDPPAGVRFMSTAFDSDHGHPDKWAEYMGARFRAQREACIPGAYGVYWALPRTADWTARALRIAGWHIVDKIHHVFGQGWNKAASQLKPAQEDWFLVRDTRSTHVRPLNMDACRVARGMSGSMPTNFLASHCPACRSAGARKVKGSGPNDGLGQKLSRSLYAQDDYSRNMLRAPHPSFSSADGTETVPAFDCLVACACGLASLCAAGGSPSDCPGCGEPRWWCCPVAALDEQSAAMGMHSAGGATDGATIADVAQTGYGGSMIGKSTRHGDVGNGSAASRFFPQFFYDAKASKRERQAGCEGLLWVRDKSAAIGWRRVSQAEYDASDDRAEGNVHPTIKPVGITDRDGLLRWLVRLVTPERGPVLDGMAGSGTTGLACRVEGRDALLIDIDPGAADIMRARLDYWTPERIASEQKKKPQRKAKSVPAPKAPPPPSAPRQLDIFGGRAA